MNTRKIATLLLVMGIFFSQFNYLNGNTKINAEEKTSEQVTSESPNTTPEETTPEETTENTYTGISTTEASMARNIDVTMLSTNFLAAGDITDDNEAITVASGQQVLVMAKFSVTSDEFIGEKRLGFRVELPEKHGFLAAQSDLYEYVIAGPAGQTDTTVVPGKNYLWIVLKNEINSGDTKSLSFYVNPTATGITPNNKQVNIAIQPYDMSSFTSVGNTITNTINSKTTQFAWNDVDAYMRTGGEFQSQGQENIPLMHFGRNSTPKYNFAVTGNSFLKTVSYSSTFTVPLGTQNGQEGKPLVLIKPENLTWTNGVPLVVGTDYVVDEWTDATQTYIKAFRTTLKATNPGQTSDFNRNIEFQIRNATLSRQAIISEYNLSPNATSPAFWLTESNHNNSVEPLVDVEGIGTTAQKIGQNRFNSVRFIFKNTLETGDETAIKSVFTKKIIKIGAVATQSTQNDKLAAYPNDVITYQIGQGYKNFQKTELAELNFKEVSGVGGYDKTEILPFRVSTGKYSVGGVVPTTTNLSITITYIDGTPTINKVLSGAELSTSTSISLPAGNLDKIAEINYNFTNVEPNFQVDAGPILEYRVVQQNDQTMTGKKFTNTATQSYTYNNPDNSGIPFKSQSTASAFFFYKEKMTDEYGRFEQNKTGTNLYSGKKPVKDEVVLFTIEVKNENPAAWDIEKLVDSYTHNLSLYDGDKTKDNTVSAPGIDASLLSDQTANLIVWDPADPTKPLAGTDIVKQVTNTDPAAGGMGTVVIEFQTGKMKVLPGQTLKLTYTMKANQNNKPEQTIGNTYDMFGMGNKMLATGEFWWSIPLPGLADNNRNKKWENFSAVKTTDAPIAEEIVAFTVTVKNDSGRDWEDKIQVIDTYDAFLTPYQGLDEIETGSPNFAKLDESKPLNLGVLSAPATFDPSAVNITLQEDSNQFTIDLGQNTIKDGEEVKFIYTMKIKKGVVPKQKVVNQFVVKVDNIVTTTGRCEFLINIYSGFDGVISFLKSAAGVGTAKVEGLLDDENVLYTVTATNELVKKNVDIQVKNIIDALPNNMVYQNSTTRVYKIKRDGNGTELSRVELATTEYTVDYPFATTQVATDNILTIKLNTPVALKGKIQKQGVITEQDFLEVTYEAKLDTHSNLFPAIPSTDRIVDRINNVKLYIVEDKTAILNFKQGGAILEDTTNADNDDTTKTTINSSATVKVANSRALFGNIYMDTLKNANVDVNGDTTRAYQGVVENYSVVPLATDKIIALLPVYESLNTAAPIKWVLAGVEYDAVYTKSKITLVTGEVRNRLIVTGYIDENGVTQKLVIPKAVNSTTRTYTLLKYSTIIDGATAQDKMISMDKPSLATKSQIAMYLANNNKMKITTTTTSALINLDNNLGEDWDEDATTGERYENSNNESLFMYSISPGTGAKPFKVTTSGNSEQLVEYQQGVTTINPGDIVVWQVLAGNAPGGAIKNMEAGAKLLVVVPNGMIYQTSDWTVDNQRTDAHGNTILEFTIPERSPNAYGFNNIRVSTADNKFATYELKTYLVPKQSMSQYFFHSVVSSSPWVSTWKYIDETKDLSHLDTSLVGDSHYVAGQGNVDVYGELGISSTISVTEISTGKKVSSRTPGDRILDLVGKDSPLKYTMNLNVEKAINGFNSTVFINKLPSKGDTSSIDGSERESEAAVRLIEDGNVEVKVTNLDNQQTIKTLTEGTDYVVEYFDGPITEEFTADDWNGVENLSRWKPLTSFTRVNLENVNAIRVRVLDTTFKIEYRQSFEVSYEAKLHNYDVRNTTAFNSFAYNGKIKSVEVQAEPLKIGVRAPIYNDTINITKVLNDLSATPAVKSFDINLIGTDIDGTEQYRQAVTIETNTAIDENLDTVIEGWKATTQLVDLPLDLDYTVEETVPTGFETPTINLIKTDLGNAQTHWEFVVTNTPIYQVVYDGNTSTDGIVPVDSNNPYHALDSVTVLGEGTLVKTNYTFTGWNTTQNGSGTAYAENETFAITADTTLYAQWQENAKFSVTYDGNTHTSGTPPSDTFNPYYVNSTVTVLGESTLTKANYTFAGWNTKQDGSGTAYTANETFTITADTILYAQWQENAKFTVTYDGNTHTDGIEPTDTLNPYYVDSTVTVLSENTLVKTNYTFTGWNTEQDGSGTAYTANATFTITADTTLYAQWQENAKFTVTYDGNTNTSGTEPIDPLNPYYVNSTVTVLSENTLVKTNYTFIGWNTEQDGSGATYAANDTFVIAADTTLYAQWQENGKLAIIYDGNTNTAGAKPIDANSPYYINSTVIVLGENTLEKANYTFTGWNTTQDGSGTTYAENATFTITTNTILYAQWQENAKFTITYDGNTNTSGTEPTDSSNPYYVNSTVTVLGENTLEKANYTFTGWNTIQDGSGTTYTESDTFTITADTTLYAQWQENAKFTITYDGNTNTSGTEPTDLLNPYYVNSTVTVLGENTLEKANYTFTGWNTTQDGSGTTYTENATFTITADTTLYAQWSEGIKYTITYDGNTNTGGEAPIDSKLYYAGTDVEALSAGTLIKANHRFMGWNTKADGTGVGYTIRGLVRMPSANVIVYAQWLEDEKVTVTYDGNTNTSGEAPTDINNPYYIASEVNVMGQNTLIKENYTFKSWNTALDGTGIEYQASATFVITENTTLYAQWIEDNKYSMMYDGNGHTLGEAPVDNNTYYAGELANIKGKSTLEKEGHDFVAWNTKKDGSGDTYLEELKSSNISALLTSSITMPPANVMLYAQWTPKEVEKPVVLPETGEHTEEVKTIGITILVLSLGAIIITRKKAENKQ